MNQVKWNFKWPIKAKGLTQDAQTQTPWMLEVLFFPSQEIITPRLPPDMKIANTLKLFAPQLLVHDE